jgi:hypothetical protein
MSGAVMHEAMSGGLLRSRRTYTLSLHAASGPGQFNWDKNHDREG